MTSIARIGCAALTLALSISLAAGCGRAPASIDLVDVLPSAERRALGPPDESIHAIAVSHDGGSESALLTTAPARVLFPVRMPARARLRAQVSLAQPATGGVTIRVGIADNRLYDELLRLPITPATSSGASAWQAIDVDLGSYSGWQWSIFYQPARKTWKLVLNADPSPGGSVVWLHPTIEMRR